MGMAETGTEISHGEGVGKVMRMGLPFSAQDKGRQNAAAPQRGTKDLY